MTAPTATRGSYSNGRRTRAQLIEEATRAFATTGFHGSSIREIAGTVGVSAPTLLAHFGRKEDLLLAVLDAWDETTRAIEPARAPGLGWFARYPNLMRFHMANPGLLQLFVTISAEAIDPAHPAHAWATSRVQRLQHRGGEQLEIAAQQGDAIAMSAVDRNRSVRSLYAVMDGYAVRWLLVRDFDLAEEYGVEFDATMRRWRGR